MSDDEKIAEIEMFFASVTKASCDGMRWRLIQEGGHQMDFVGSIDALLAAVRTFPSEARRDRRRIN